MIISLILFQLMFGLLFPAYVFSSFLRLNRFSAVVDDEIEFKYKSFDEYVKKTKRTFIPLNPNRKKMNLDIHRSYNNLNPLKFWDWDFKAMLVEEIK